MIIDYKPIAVKLLEAMCIHENSYVHPENDELQGKYLVTEDEAFASVSDSEAEAEFLALTTYSADNDLQTWAEVTYGLMLKRFGGTPYTYDEDIISQSGTTKGEIVFRAGDVMMASGEPMIKGGELMIIEVEPGYKNYCERHGYEYDEGDGYATVDSGTPVE